MLQEQELAALFSKYLSGKASRMELEALLDLYAMDNMADSLSDLIYAELAQSDEIQLEARQLLAVNRVGDRLAQHIAQRKTRMRRLYIIYAAAALLLLGGAFSFLRLALLPDAQLEEFNSLAISSGTDKAILQLEDGTTINIDKDSSTLAQQPFVFTDKDGMLTLDSKDLPAKLGAGERTLSTPVGGQLAVLLADGSKVWLNAASSITFPINFDKQNRRVAITGEVYFEVAKQAGQAFTVQVAQQTVKVLGTHFNINAYPEHKSVQTSLFEGSVEVAAGNKVLRLKPGQCALWQADKNGLNMESGIDQEALLAWKNGMFCFNQTHIVEIMHVLSRWYAVEVVFEQADYKDCFFTGMISKKEHIVQVLEVLKASNELNFSIDGNKVKVLRKNKL